MFHDAMMMSGGMIMQAIGMLIILVAMIAAIGIATGYPAALWIGDKVAEFISCLPNERFAVAPPIMGPPASKAIRGDLQEALADYEALLENYPDEPEIYRKIIELTLGPMNQSELAEDYLHLAMENLQDAKDRSRLIKLAASIKSGEYCPFQHLQTEKLRSTRRALAYISKVPAVKKLL
ncbi:hypothetical protein JIN85_15960 [Luteolibacter pohnpeiensis]|uniref:Tetratricopeptide repeat protein n=1 Tax=Luteolibacter pohnpeiensis TaxID=454153 RepID=A0A934SDK1_9BACT|nr:hypothetical protein [Luteolibacter pohnpeiensis]MBK1883914.1 hypothetical protein [Luteolibacter pohnpeiensis]